MTTPIDLCYSCIAAVASNVYPTRAYSPGETPKAYNGEQFNYIGPKTARRIMNEEIEIFGQDGLRLPMIAMTTVDNSRVCALHVFVRKGRDYASSAPGYGVFGQKDLP
jgi:hypothetical protein